jgi:hypothetical protein
MTKDLKKFDTEGYIGPFKLDDVSQISSLLNERYIPRHLYGWQKSPHEKSEPIIKFATDKNLLEKLKNVLKENILLWGSLFVEQKPGGQSTWHLDVEHGSWDGATAWIGLKNLNEKTSLSIITYSHLLNTTPIELKKKINLDCADDDAVLREAKKIDSRCELKTFYLKPGEFIIWSGRIWHETLNESNKVRQSIILQYCTPENKVKIPLNFDYPNTKWSEIKPTCVLISGKDNFSYNTVLDKESVKPSIALFRKFKVSVIYNLRFKLASSYRQFKSFF